MNITKEQYKRALTADGVLKDDNVDLLSFLFYSPQCEATAPQISEALGLGHQTGPANSKLGNLGKRIAKHLSIDMPDRENKSPGWWQLIAHGEDKPEGFTWSLKSELAEALSELGLLDEEDRIFPELVPVEIELKEGASKTVRVNVYERNPIARKICINHYGANCIVCGFDFNELAASAPEAPSEEAVSERAEEIKQASVNNPEYMNWLIENWGHVADQ